MKKINFRADILPLKNELYRLALRITLNHAEAEDVVQETMIKVWNRREQWDEIESIEADGMTTVRTHRSTRPTTTRLTAHTEPTPRSRPSSATASDWCSN